MLQIAATAHGLDLSTPFEKFPEKVQNLLLFGEAGKAARPVSAGFSAI
jgi:excinuclease UvrABC ATPase subunit